MTTFPSAAVQQTAPKNDGFKLETAMTKLNEETAQNSSYSSHCVELKLLLRKMLIQNTYTKKKECWKSSVARLTHISLRNILKSFNIDIIDCKMKSLHNNIRFSLVRWMRFVKPCTDISHYNELYDSLYEFLKKNLTNVCKNKLETIKENENNDCDDIIAVVCPLKVLKTLFASDPNRYDVFSMTPRISCTSSADVFTITNENLINWPYVTVKLSLPDIVLTRSNIIHNDFRVVNMKYKHKPEITELVNTTLHFRPGNGTKEVTSFFINRYIRLYLNYFKKCKLIDTFRKSCIISFLQNYLLDLYRARYSIFVGTEYYSNLFQYPYVRYLAYTETPCQQTFDIIDSQNENNVNVRLQQISYPGVRFTIDEFLSSAMKNYIANDILEEMEINMISNNDFLIYTCELCDITFVNADATINLVKHIRDKHGFEENWLCLNCEKVYSHETLTSQRWFHNCDGEQVNK